MMRVIAAGGRLEVRGQLLRRHAGTRLRVRASPAHRRAHLRRTYARTRIPIATWTNSTGPTQPPRQWPKRTRVCVAGLDDGVDSLGGSSLACSSVRLGATLSHRSGHRSSYPRMQALSTAPRRSGHRSSHPRQVERQGERAAERTSSTRGFHQHIRSPGQHTRSPVASHHHHHHHRCRRQQQEQQQLEEEHTHPNPHPPPLPSPPQQQHRHARDPHERHTDRLQRRYQAQEFEHHAHRGRRGPESAGPQKHKQLRTKAVCIHHESDGVSV